MFINEKDVKKFPKIETLIGEGCSLVGNLNGEGLIKLDGSIEGDINWLDDIIIGASCSYLGNVTCKNATIDGTVQGNMICEENLVISPSGRLIGNITVKNLEICKGGYFDGKCTMIVEKPEKELMG